MTGFVKVAGVTEPEDKEADCHDKAGNNHEESVLDTANVRTAVVEILSFGRGCTCIRLLSFHNFCKKVFL